MKSCCRSYTNEMTYFTVYSFKAAPVAIQMYYFTVYSFKQLQWLYR